MKKNIKIIISLTFALTYALVFSGLAFADGIIIPEPPICGTGSCPEPFPIEFLVIKYHHVDVEIIDQIAVTHVDQVFFNPNEYAVEGTYVFPLPLDATVTEFILWIDGEPVEGEVLDANEARQVYEEIVRQMVDPALLEYVGQGAVRASVFPIPAGGDRRIELEYTQALSSENGLIKYTYPLNTEKFSIEPLGSVSVNVEIESNQAVRAVYSPTHPVDVVNYSKTHVVAGYEDRNVTPDTDFTLFYSIGENEAFHLLTYRDPSDPFDSNGYFLLMLAPEPDVNQKVLSKDVILVLDKSGSMDGEKFIQAQAALRYILEHLNPDDRFNVISFSTGLAMFDNELQPASQADEAIDWVDSLWPAGGTDINRALLEAAYMADQERPTYLIFMTDGLPTQGEQNVDRIISNFSENSKSNIRLFAFGVGYDVDTFLLGTLAQENHGATTYVLPGESLDEVISGFYEKISTPVMTDLELDFGDIKVYDVYPNPLPDLFSGSQIIITGRYRGAGIEDVILRGRVNEDSQRIIFEDQVFSRDTRDDGKHLETIPRLWATRKIGYLLNQIRLYGVDEETVGQIVKLSIRFGIVTPYTSYLVTEDMALGESAQDDIAAEEFERISSESNAPTSGMDAVEKAVGEGNLLDADSSYEMADDVGGVDVSEVVKVLGQQTFVYIDGVWIDTRFDPNEMRVVEVEFLSDEYFDLIAENQSLGAAFSLGSNVIAIFDGTIYSVAPKGEENPIGEGIIEESNPDNYEVQVDDESEFDLSDLLNGSCLNGVFALLLPAVGIVLKRRL